VRLFRNVRGYEVAVYGYNGFWKSPAGSDPGTGRFTFPPLAVYGASVRGPLAGGIGHAEAGYYDSRDDRSGENPTVANCEWRLLAGYERELATDLTATAQYYLEHMLDHEAYRKSLPPGAVEADDTRHAFTLRLRQLLLQQTLELSLFVRYSPTDDDAYFRPKIGYKASDAWRIELGGNLFTGRKPYTFLNQFARNNSLYLAARYSF
jgi:hypothetical protein